MSHYNLVNKFVLVLQVMKIPDAKAAVDGAWKKREKLPAWRMTKVKSKNGGHSGSTEGAKNSPFCYADAHQSSQECGVRTEVSKKKKKTKAGLCSEVT